MKALSKIKKTMRQLITSRKDMEMVVQLGNLQGVVKADNFNNVYVTFMDGEVMTVLNQSVPNIRSYVVIGYRNNKNPLQVLMSLNAFSNPLLPDIPDHDHTWGKSNNPNWIRGEQILAGGLVSPIAGTLTVDLKGFVYYLDGGWHFVDTQVIDLSGEVSATGANWVLIEIDNAGVVTLNAGSAVAGREVLEYADIPDVTTGKMPLGAVKMYAGQTQIIESVTDPDVRDLRWAKFFSTTGGGGGTSIPILTSDPVSPGDGELWLLRETTGAIADGTPMGLLLALTYTGNAGSTAPLQLSVWDDVTNQIVRY